MVLYHLHQNFYEDLNLSKYIEKQETGVNYKLIGVITHLGGNGASGHFIGICKSRINKQWYMFNDQTVTKSTLNDALNKGTPYILFYHAC